jgi:hypothetical protein
LPYFFVSHLLLPYIAAPTVTAFNTLSSIIVGKFNSTLLRPTLVLPCLIAAPRETPDLTRSIDLYSK